MSARSGRNPGSAIVAALVVAVHYPIKAVMTTVPTPNLKQDGREEKAKPSASERAVRPTHGAPPRWVISENGTFGTATETPLRSGKAGLAHQVASGILW